MKNKLYFVTVVVMLIFVVVVFTKTNEEKKIAQSNSNQQLFYSTLSQEELNIKRFISNIATETEIVLLEEIGSSNIEYSRNSNNMFSSVTESNIKILIDYTAILTIATNSISFVTIGDTVSIVYDPVDILIKSIEINNENILRDKDWLGKAFTDDEVIAMECTLVDNIRNTIKNDHDIISKAEKSLQTYFTDLALNLNVKITFN